MQSIYWISCVILHLRQFYDSDWWKTEVHFLMYPCNWYMPGVYKPCAHVYIQMRHMTTGDRIKINIFSFKWKMGWSIKSLSHSGQGYIRKCIPACPDVTLRASQLHLDLQGYIFWCIPGKNVTMINIDGQSRISETGVGDNCSGWALAYYLINFSQKLHEHDEFWVLRGRAPPVPPFGSATDYDSKHIVLTYVCILGHISNI